MDRGRLLGCGCHRGVVAWRRILRCAYQINPISETEKVPEGYIVFVKGNKTVAGVKNVYTSLFLPLLQAIQLFS